MKSPADKNTADKSRKGLQVVSSRGNRQRFLRGMITHDLVQRGLDFDRAYAAARAVRDQLAGRDEVTTSEIRDLVTQHLDRVLGVELLPSLKTAPPERYVTRQGERRPFSRGLVARSIYAIGVDIDRGYHLIAELEANLRAEGLQEVSSEDLGHRVAELLERFEGPAAARQYRLVRRAHRLPRPLVLYIGGASGTGKSTLALELAPLLRVYRINATDTIRQVMRMVFSQDILPVLYRSSFELAPEQLVGGESEDELADLLARGFEEQAVRVSVGIRALVERAVAENSNVLVEGVHLFPPLIPFSDLEGVTYQIPLLLAVPDEEIHRSRFLSRGRLGRRRSDRYLDHFREIRAIQDFLLQQAETHDVPIVDSSDPEPTARTLRLLTSILEQRLPAIFQQGWGREGLPTLLVILDGLADRPVEALGGQTPLQAAATPCLDRLARDGSCGLADTVAPGVVPDTAAGTLALLGQSPRAMQRGPIEALGAGLKLIPGDVALRANLATLDKAGRIVDRRAGRIREGTAELAQALNGLDVGDNDRIEVLVKAGTEHRLAVVLRGPGLSPEIHGSDPGDGGAVSPLVPSPDDPEDARAAMTARLLALFEQKARKILQRHPVNKKRVKEGLPPANAILCRGAGAVHRLLPLEENGIPLRVACVAADRTVQGIASVLGAEWIQNDAMTGNLDTDLGAKMAAALKALRSNDLVVLHLKGTDIAAHDRRPDLKAAFLEKIDRALDGLLQAHQEPLRVAVSSDHATLSESGQHAADPLPTLIWGPGIEADEVRAYNESAVADGALGRFPLQLLLGRLFELG